MTVTSMISNDTPFLPPKVTDVPKEILRNFQHSKKVGNYLLGNTLGEGSFAKVKEALHIPTGERVAVKIIDKKKSREDSYVRKNLRREGKILQMVRHAHIVQLLEIMETQNSYYLVTELCRGGDLMDYISQRRKLPESEVKKYIRQIVSAVDYLHRLGILHRDLKIENLLLDEFRDMKLIDFGLSNCVKLVQTKDGPRVQDFCVTQCGSPAYAAPELLGRKKYGPQVDVWSIGVNMYAMLTGNLPFTVEPFNIKALHTKMLTGQMNPLPDAVSRDCRDLIKRLLNPDPERRITVEEMLKHPWIAEGPGCPLVRAPCPNKVKADTIDNSILRHMAENQGFRIGEVVRYVTGNVPSSATAMYCLIHRKLQKHYGNLRASGKIAADNRAMNRPNNIIEARLSRPGTSTKPQQTPHPVTPHPGTPHPSPIAQRHATTTVRPAVTTHARSRDRAGSQGDQDAESLGDSSRGTDDDKSEDTDDTFSDILQTKVTTPVMQIPRATLTTKPQNKDGGDVHRASTNLPRVAKKYAVSNRRNTAPNTTEIGESPENKPEMEQTHKTRTEKRSATETSAEKEDIFRPRASTFPGKIQRPTLAINKLVKDKSDQVMSNEKGKTENLSRGRLYKSKMDNHVTREHVTSPTGHVGKGSMYVREYVPSPSPRQTGTSQQLIQFRKHSGVQRRIAIAHKSRDADIVGSHDSINEDEASSHVGKSFTSRPAMTNRFTRVSKAHNHNKVDRVVEFVTDISQPNTRPVSSLNMPTSNNFRSATPILPSLTPSFDSNRR
ncbi:MAP/microtubule affinity-regulating kinase 4-like [Mya arenaria]|uniref:MAP/microtubule affinity-regulating kinase 4-like n=1 Tax=Mya arenaria TaxID=6604 RepID=UPI0022E01B7B|nr:MAP/microtubule affinity-regulating kinase 4-like [Mya arenaria]